MGKQESFKTWLTGCIVLVKGRFDRSANFLSLKNILLLEIVMCEKSYSLHSYPASYKDFASPDKTRNPQIIFF
jgi:hypothetical protein